VEKRWLHCQIAQWRCVERIAFDRIGGHQSGAYDIGSEPYFAKIHSDPRWLPRLRKVGFAPERLARIGHKVTLPPDWRE